MVEPEANPVFIIAFAGILFHAQFANGFDASRFCFVMPLTLKTMRKLRIRTKVFPENRHFVRPSAAINFPCRVGEAHYRMNKRQFIKSIFEIKPPIHMIKEI